MFSRKSRLYITSNIPIANLPLKLIRSGYCEQNVFLLHRLYSYDIKAEQRCRESIINAYRDHLWNTNARCGCSGGGDGGRHAPRSLSFLAAAVRRCRPLAGKRRTAFDIAANASPLHGVDTFTNHRAVLLKHSL